MNSKFFRDVMPSPENDPGVICKPFYEFPGMDSLQGFDTMSKAVFAMKCAIIDIVCKECGVDPKPYLNEASVIRFKDGYCQVSLAKAMGERWCNAPHLRDRGVEIAYKMQVNSGKLSREHLINGVVGDKLFRKARIEYLAQRNK